MPLPFYTVGHSTRTIEAFVALLHVAEIELVVDIRTVRRSRANPQYNGDTLPARLAEFGLAYASVAALGGLRGHVKTVPPSLNGRWKNQSFHNYADYTLSDAFRAGLDALIALGRERRSAMMCAEAVWWRCHRRIVADHLLVRGERVWHLLGEKRIEPARLTEGARLTASGSLVYPAPEAVAETQPIGLPATPAPPPER